MRGEAVRPVEDEQKVIDPATDEEESANGKTRKKEANGKKVENGESGKKQETVKVEAAGAAARQIDVQGQKEKATAKADSEGQDEVLYEDEKNSTKVFKTPEGKLFIVGVKFDEKSIKSLLKKADVDVEIEFSKDWDTKTLQEKRRYLREKGIELLPAISGAAEGETGVNWLDEFPDSSEVSEELAPFVREIERVSKSSKLARTEYDRLTGIAGELSKAIINKTIPADSEVNDVLDQLSRHVDDLALQVAQEQELGLFRRGTEVPRAGTEYDAETRNAAESLIKLAADGMTSGEQWDALYSQLDSKIKGIEALVSAAQPAGYKKAYLISKGIENVFYENSDVVKLLPGEVRNRLKHAFGDDGLLVQLDRKFNSIFNAMDKKSQHALIGDIDSNSTTFLKMISAGWGETLEGAKGKLLGMIGEDPKGLREWRVFKHINGLEQSVRVKQSTEVIPIWEEIPEKLTTVFSQMESMDFSVEELSVATQEAITLVRSVAPDTPEGRKLRDDLVDQLEAFRAFHSMRITMERNDMNPERMLEVFQNYFDDETWEHFAERFSRDDRFREFVIETEGEGGGKKLESANVFDTAFSNYSERLRQERIKMNMVEELTRHAIENPLSSAQVDQIARSMNHTVDDDFRNQLEVLRQYFVEKTQAYINDPKNEIAGRSVDNVWGRKHKINGKNTIDITQQLVQNWHNKRTLQGAFGFAEEGDLADLMAEFGISDEKVARDRFLNKEFLKIRQEEMQEKLVDELKEAGLKIKVDKETTQDIDTEILKQSGFFDSVNKNAYYLTWMFEWSNYDGIRIYSRDTTSGLDDDFESLVFHQNTNMFYGRHIDHIWEFYHDTNENRGRAKENDVNRIWKQKLPGKHHYLFPQNSVMVRWVDSFMSEEQKKILEARTREMMSQWDFDNEKYHDEFYSWMKNTAVMDMIENGEVSFSSKDSGNKFSEIVKKGKIRKFEMIDVFVDRNKHKEYAGPQAFQAYLAKPSDAKFIEINDKEKVFYSTRAARQFPWMTLATRAHWEIANKNMLRLFDAKNETAVEGERLVDTLVNRGDMEKHQGVKEKRKLFGFDQIGVVNLGEVFGTTPFRRFRQMMEFSRRGLWDMKHYPVVVPIVVLWGMIAEFFKQLPKEISRQQ